VIEQRTLGRTGLRVSSIGFGTVSLGIEYGITAPGEFGRPADDEASALLREAFARGVSLYDTAPAYGESERLLGAALPGQAIIATKVSIGADVEASLRRSHELLGRPQLDVVQIHNASVDTFRSSPLLVTLEEARDRGLVRFIGASVYSEDQALAAIESGRIDVLQVAYNLLDQRMASRVFPAASAAGVGVLVRSAFLKGALTDKAAHLPPALGELRAAVERVQTELGVDAAGLSQLAFRFCLSHPSVSAVLFGARTAAELAATLTFAEAGPLPADLLQRTSKLALTDDRLLNPARWPAL
jgi:aryl-alcohol dehydrogenase-like predicted oxidoreductase